MISSGGLFLGLALGPLLIDNLLLKGTTLHITFGIGCAMAVLSTAVLFCLQETKSFVFLQDQDQSDQLLLPEPQRKSDPKLSITVILRRVSAGIRCIFTSKCARAPGIVFFASLLTMQVVVI
jgi:hypothetical protein